MIHGMPAPVTRGPREPETHVVLDGEMGEQRVVLEHDADAALLGRDDAPGARDHPAAQGDGARVGGLQTSDQAKRGGLAAARWSEERDDLAFHDAQGQAVDRGRLVGPVALADLVEDQQVHR